MDWSTTSWTDLERSIDDRPSRNEDITSDWVHPQANVSYLIGVRNMATLLVTTGVFRGGGIGPSPLAEKLFTFDMLNFEKLGYAPPPLAGQNIYTFWSFPLSEFLNTSLLVTSPTVKV